MANNKIEKGQHTLRLNLHLSKSMKDRIRRIAKDRGVPLNDAARQLIEESPDYYQIKNGENF